MSCPIFGALSLMSSVARRLKHSNKAHRTISIDWTLCSFTNMDPVSSDVIAPSPWTIFGCQNGKCGIYYLPCELARIDIWYGSCSGLRLFKEAKDKESHRKVSGILIQHLRFSRAVSCWLYYYFMQWDDHPAIMAVGVVDGTSEDIFRTLMSLGPSRSE